MITKLTVDSNTTAGTSNAVSSDDDVDIEDGIQIVRYAASKGNNGMSAEEEMLQEHDKARNTCTSIKEQHQRACIVVTCPLTQQALKDPVVNSVDGMSYERAAISYQEDQDLYYPNRALKEYLDATTATADTATCHVLTNRLDCFLCPITRGLMQDPVIDKEGNSYERSAVLDWIQLHGVSPITGTPLAIDQLYDNATLWWVLVQEIKRHPHQYHHEDAVREWKNVLSCSNKQDNPKEMIQPPQKQPSLSNDDDLDDLEINIHSLVQVPTEPDTDDIGSSANNETSTDLVVPEEGWCESILWSAFELQQSYCPCWLLSTLVAVIIIVSLQAWWIFQLLFCLGIIVIAMNFLYLIIILLRYLCCGVDERRRRIDTIE